MSNPKQPNLNGAYYGPSIPPPSKTYHRPSRGSSPCCCLFNLIFKLLLSAIITVGIAALVFWLVFCPNRFKFHITDAALTRFDLNTSSSNLYYNLDLNLTIRNPNKHIGIYYDSIQAQAFYGGQRFATTTLPRFYQGKKNTTDLSVVLSGQNIVVVKGDDLSAYNSEKSAGIYSIDMKLYLRMRLKLRGIKTPRFKPMIECDLKVPLDSNGKASVVLKQPGVDSIGSLRERIRHNRYATSAR